MLTERIDQTLVPEPMHAKADPRIGAIIAGRNRPKHLLNGFRVVFVVRHRHLYKEGTSR